MPGETWGVRSVPHITHRYPLWQQENLMQEVDAGAFYLADATEGWRETLVTTAVDARPVQCLRVPGPSFKPMIAAALTGGVFIVATFHWWWAALAFGVAAVGAILSWLWTGTALLPEKAQKDVGLGTTLPLYASGSGSVGWWAMFITMIADLTAFVSLVFGYFFYWTVHEDFPPASFPGPGMQWPLTGALLVGAAWFLTILARNRNRRERAAAFHACLLLAIAAASAGVIALLAGPLAYGMDPVLHVYPAIVWLLILWASAHVALGGIMQLYCIARRLSGRITSKYDMDVSNVTLYWHFTFITVALTVSVVAFFPELS
jgi:cytochrome c oxidase subunit I+III